ncbi:hypothetical protein [Schinkia azotoformans]|uniref:hypothetical protein n=1 Tax=Schinkia azotoformans TaxID=1454 RepID=UPI002DBA52BF|nr:hypothetical protein [Schinkia azotoformans]MEC1695517.1 hypothetical protein [Schinkia azotoformans]MEC1727166.1 hypothetical protein [Schinkia azotoformans]MEC1781985.1 hypothetical protein [Schinkia azotoformans]MED4331174.1 hypothetical protein [Schinkia azotoformans]
MPRVFIHFTFLFFFLTALSGVWMRFFFIKQNEIIPYTHILHGHSHLAMLGWAFIGAFVIFLSIFWKKVKQKKQAISILFSLCIVSLLMFIAFLYQGYNVLSIIFATLHIFIEYWAAVFIYKILKKETDIPKSGKLFINSALLTLVISSIGPYMLGLTAATGLKDTYYFDMAMYFYLHFQYNGWLTLFLIGLFIIIIHMKKIPIEGSTLKLGFWIYFLSLFPGYFLSILFINLGSIIPTLAIIGSIGQWIGILFILAAFKKIWGDLSQYYSKLTMNCLWITLILLFIKSTAELGLISPALADLVYNTRSIVIGYLHLTLLGFVSIFIITQYFMVNLIDSKAKISSNGFIIFITGFALNELLLFSQGLSEWLKLVGIPFFTEGLFVASGLLLIGVITLWLSFGTRKQHHMT